MKVKHAAQGINEVDCIYPDAIDAVAQVLSDDTKGLWGRLEALPLATKIVSALVEIEALAQPVQCTYGTPSGVIDCENLSPIGSDTCLLHR